MRLCRSIYLNNLENKIVGISRLRTIFYKAKCILLNISYKVNIEIYRNFSFHFYKYPFLFISLN